MCDNDSIKARRGEIKACYLGSYTIRGIILVLFEDRLWGTKGVHYKL